MKTKRAQAPASDNATHQSGASRKETHLRKLSRLSVCLLATASEYPPEQLRQTVLQQFRTKAMAAGVSGAALENAMRRILIINVPAGRYLPSSANSSDFVSVVGLGAVKTVIPWGVVDPAEKTQAVSGELCRRIRKRRWLTVQFAKPSYIVGLMPAARGYAAREFAAVAHANSVVAVVGRELITEVLANTPAPGRLLMMAYHSRALSRLIATKCRLLSLGTVDRLRDEVVQLAREFPLESHPGAIKLKLQQQDFAELIGATRPTVAHAIGRLKARGAVSFDRTLGRYVVRPDLVTAPHLAPAGRQPAEGYAAGAAEREGFRKILWWATRHVGLPQAVFDLLVNGAELRAYDPEDVIGVEDRFYASVLISGAARLLVEVSPGRDVGVCIVKPGQFIGAGWVTDAGARVPAFHATAHDTGNGEPCHIAILKEDVLLRALDALTPAEILRLFDYCHAALSRQLYDRTVLLPLSNSERLLYQLHVLAADFPRALPHGTAIDLPLNFRRDLAPLIATDGRGILRAKQDLQEAGRIKILDEGRILIVGFHIARSVA